MFTQPNNNNSGVTRSNIYFQHNSIGGAATTIVSVLVVNGVIFLTAKDLQPLIVNRMNLKLNSFSVNHVKISRTFQLNASAVLVD